MNAYNYGQPVRISVQFTDASGNAADPTTQAVNFTSPSGGVSSYDEGDVTKTAIGAYYKDYTPYEHGRWQWDWDGDGAVVAVGDGSFYVRPATSIEWLVTLDDLKDHLDIEETTTVHDAAMCRWLEALTRWTERQTGRVFRQLTGQTRYYDANIEGTVDVIDLISVASLHYDINNDRAYSEAWTQNTHYELLPRTSETGEPSVRFDTVAPLPNGGKSFTPGRPVKIVGNWGYVEDGACPVDLASGALLYGAKWFARRDAVFSLMNMPAIGFHRIFQEDPDAWLLIRPFIHKRKRRTIQ